MWRSRKGLLRELSFDSCEGRWHSGAGIECDLSAVRCALIRGGLTLDRISARACWCSPESNDSFNRLKKRNSSRITVAKCLFGQQAARFPETTWRLTEAADDRQLSKPSPATAARERRFESCRGRQSVTSEIAR
jgi:hypothetical protein